MLRVIHTPIDGAVGGPVPVSAFVESMGGRAITEVRLVWRADGGPWQEQPMTTDGSGVYLGAVPADVVERGIDYHILANDDEGREEGSPRVAPARFHSFTLEATTGIDDAPPVVLAHGNAPNPFNPATVFTFALRDPAPVRLTVVDPRGRVVRRLLEGEERPAGPNEIRWDGRDDAGREVPSGSYLFVLEAVGMRYARPASLIR